MAIGLSILPPACAQDDTTPPDVSVTSGLDADDIYPLRVEATDTGSGVSRVKYYINDNMKDDLPSMGDDIYGRDLDTSGLDDGEHTIYVMARDNAGNWNNDTSVTITVKHMKPARLVIDDFSTDKPFVEGVVQGSEVTFTITLRNTGDEAVKAKDLTYSIYVDDAVGTKEPTNRISPELVFPDEIPGGGTAVIEYRFTADLELGPKLVGLKMVYNDGETEGTHFTPQGILVHDGVENDDAPAPGTIAVLFSVMAAAALCGLRRRG
jgi:hypothetical protein